MSRLSRVRNALYGQPWCITPEWLEAICEIFERHAANEDKLIAQYEAAAVASKRRMSPDGGYEIRGNGVAVVNLLGPIFPRANLMTQMSGATSIEEFTTNFKTALEDTKTNAVILRVDSPGGSVLGTFEAAASVFASRQQPKPVVALAEGMMASAAYLVGSQADAVYATEASLVGSIGVIMRMDSMERKLLNEGVDSVILKTGKYKAIGSGPITEEQKGMLQSMVDDYFSRFKDAVTRARAGIDIDSVATGEVWIGQKAQQVGLIDGIETLESLVQTLLPG